MRRSESDSLEFPKGSALGSTLEMAGLATLPEMGRLYRRSVFLLSLSYCRCASALLPNFFVSSPPVRELCYIAARSIFTASSFEEPHSEIRRQGTTAYARRAE